MSTDLTTTPKDKPADSPKYKRLSAIDHALILRLHDQGLTQVEIAQRLGRAQSTISDVLNLFTDTSDLAKRYFAGQALAYAQDITETGRAADKVQVLSRIGVIGDDKAAGFTIQIGIKDSDVSLTLSPGEGQ